MRIGIIKKAVLLLSVPLLFQAGSIIAFQGMLNGSRHAWNEQSKVDRQISLLDNMTGCVIDSAVSMYSYLCTRNAIYAEKQQEASRQWRRLYELALRLLPAESRTSFEAGEIDFEFVFQVHATTIAQSTGQDRIIDFYQLLKQFSGWEQDVDTAYIWDFATRPSGISQAIDDAKKRMNEARTERKQQNASMVFLLVAVGSLALVTTGAVLTLLLRSLDTRMKVVSNNIRRFSRGEALLPPLAGSDEIAQLDGALHREVDQLKRLEQFRRETIAAVSHDLRAPLTSMGGTLTLMAEGAYGSVGKDAENSLRKAVGTTERLHALAENLILTDSIERGKIALHLTKCSAASIVDEAESAVLGLIEQKHLTLIRRIEELDLEIDRARIIQVLVNLFTRAIEQAGDHSSLEIEVTAQGRAIQFILAISKIVSTNTDTRSRKGASETDLAVARLIVEAHDGQLGFEQSGEDKARYWFSLPPDQTGSTEPGQEESPTTHKQENASQGVKNWTLALFTLPILGLAIIIALQVYGWLSIDRMVEKAENARSIAALSTQFVEHYQKSVIAVFLGSALPDQGGMQLFETEMKVVRDISSKLDSAMTENMQSKNKQELSQIEPALTQYEELAKFIFAPENKELAIRKIEEKSHLAPDRVLAMPLKSMRTILKNESKRVAELSEEVLEFSDILIERLWTIFAITMATTITLTIIVFGGFSRRLRELIQNAGAIARDESSEPVTGIDEIAQLGRALEDASRSRQQMELSKERLVDSIQHELQKPLDGLRFTLHSLKLGLQGELTDLATKRLELVEEDNERLIRLIRSLMDLSTSESDSLELNLEELDAMEIVSTARASMAKLAEEKNISIEVEKVPSDDPVQDLWLIADRDRMVRVIINLLSNAIHYSPEGSTITITVGADENGLRWSVADRGDGIPSEHLLRIMDGKAGQYSQEPDERGKTSGFGLGLRICRKIIESHGGTLKAESVMNSGSTFSVQIPREPLT